MVAHRGAVVRHSSEILLVVVLRPKFIGSPPLRVMMVPEMEMQGLAEKTKPIPFFFIHRLFLMHSYSRTLLKDSRVYKCLHY